MNDEQRRLVQVHTLQGMFRGHLHAGQSVSTLNEINIVGNNFLTIHDPVVISGEWTLHRCPLAIAKSSILFLVEMEPVEHRPGYTAQSDFFMPTPLKLWVKDHSIQGYLHVPPGVTAMARLKQTTTAFTALTAAVIKKVGGTQDAAFVAVNRSHIVAAQEIHDPAMKPARTSLEVMEPEPEAQPVG